MRKVFLDDLPIWTEGNNKGKINWENSIGYTIKFIYDDFKGEFEIIEHQMIGEIGKKKRGYLKIKYNNDLFDISITSIKRVKFKNILNAPMKYNHYYIYDIENIVECKNTNYKILEQKMMQVEDNRRRTGYLVKCLRCGSIYDKEERKLKKGDGCIYCDRKRVKIGFNDAYTTHNEIAQLLKNPEEAKTITSGNNSKKLDWICLSCGKELSGKDFSNVRRHGLQCPLCSDGISYPERLMGNLLKQLEINFEKQKTFKWSNNKRYDFYIPSLNCIIEVHGIQHYEKSFDLLGGRSLDEEQENDRLKEKVAKENGIVNYIVIDCRRSKLVYIRNNILKSKLNSLLQINNIVWEQCDINSRKSLIIETCELWNSGVKSISKLCNIFNLDKTTIINYLKKGAENGFCSYFPRNKGKQIICLNTLEIFDSVNKAQIKYNTYRIYGCLKGKYEFSGIHPETSEQLRWMYKEDYDQYINK